MRSRLALCLLVVLSARAAAARDLPDWASAATKVLEEQKYQSADAVVLLDQWSLDIGKSERKATRQWVVAVLTEKGASQAALPLVKNQFNKIRSIKAWNRDARGGVQRYDESDGTLWSAVDSKLFADSEALVVHAPHPAPGTVFAVSYEVTYDGSLPQDLFVVQTDIPVALFRMQARVRSDKSVQVRVGQAANPGPAQLQGEATWEFRDLPPIAVTADGYAEKPPLVQLAFNYTLNESTPTADWASLARWMNDLYQKSSERGEKFNAQAATVKAAPDAFQAAGHAARSVRYFGIELGWGGWIPRAPEVTLARKFGDCKDKALLMSDLLRASGSDAVPVLISSPSHVFVDPDLPTMFRFNHAIVGVPWAGKAVEPSMVVVDSPGIGPLRLFDATLPDDSVQDLSPIHNGAVGLAVDPKTTGVLRVPDGDADSNRWDTRCRWSWSADATVTVECDREVTGTARVWLEPENGKRTSDQQVAQLTHEDVFRECPSYAALQIDPLQMPPSGAWRYSYRYTCPGSLSHFGSTTLMRLPELASLDYFPLPGLTKADTVFQPYLRSRHTVISIDNAAALDNALEPFTVSNPLGSVSLSVETKDGRLLVTRTTKATQRQINKDQAGAAKELRSALARANTAVVVLK